MRILTVIFSLMFSYQAFAGGATGGTPGKQNLNTLLDKNESLLFSGDESSGSGFVIGEDTIDLSEIRAIGKDHLALEKSRLLDVVSESMTSRKPMLFNGEKLSADHYDFKTESLLLRSLDDPTRMITLEAISPE